MATQTVLAKKKRGPAPTGIGVQVVVRMQPNPLSALDRWAAKQSDQPTRAEAIRRLVELGLTVKAKPKQLAAARAEQAKELAAQVIDKMSDDLASAVDQARRKRRLLKGPPEFREDRVDLPKARK
jgi:hypothetical protein